MWFILRVVSVLMIWTRYHFRIMLGLRTKDGVDLKILDRCFNHCLDNRFNNLLIQLTREKLCKIEKNNFSLTQKGMCYLDNITQELIDCI